MQVAVQQESFQAANGVEHVGLPRRPMMPILRNCSMGLQQGSATGGMLGLWAKARDSGKPASTMLAACIPSPPSPPCPAICAITPCAIWPGCCCPNRCWPRPLAPAPPAQRQRMGRRAGAPGGLAGAAGRRPRRTGALADPGLQPATRPLLRAPLAVRPGARTGHPPAGRQPAGAGGRADPRRAGPAAPRRRGRASPGTGHQALPRPAPRPGRGRLAMARPGQPGPPRPQAGTPRPTPVAALLQPGMPPAAGGAGRLAGQRRTWLGGYLLPLAGRLHRAPGRQWRAPARTLAAAQRDRGFPRPGARCRLAALERHSWLAPARCVREDLWPREHLEHWLQALPDAPARMLVRLERNGECWEERERVFLVSDRWPQTVGA